MARICIVTRSALGSNPRVVKEADALVAAGHQVHVVSTRSLDIVDRRDDAILGTAAWSSDRIDIRTSRLWLALQPRLARLLGVETYDPVTRLLSARATRFPAELYIAHYVAALPAAAAAAQAHGARFAYDAEDFHLGDLPEGQEYASARALIRDVEAGHLVGCAYVSAASQGIAEAYEQTYGVRPATVLNVFSKALAPTAATPRGTTAPGPSVYWFSQTIGPDRGLESAVRALALSRAQPHLYLRGTVAAGYREVLGAVAAQAGVEGRVHFLAPAMPAEMEKLASAYDVGLVAETGHTPNRRIALTNKQFTYLVAGIPALMSDIPAHRRFAADAEGAVELFQADSPADLARAMDAWLCDGPALASARTHAFELGQTRFNWEAEAPKLIALVDQALGG